MEGFFLYPVSYDRQQRDSPGSIYLSNQSYYSPCANKQTTPGLEDKTQRGNNVVNPTLLFGKYPLWLMNFFSSGRVFVWVRGESRSERLTGRI